MNNDVLDDSALFRSVDHAIKFAYAIREYPIMNLSVLGQWLARGGKEKAASGAMNQHDWHAQGSMILAHITNLPDPVRAYVLANYSWGAERVIAIATIDQYVTRHIDGVSIDLLRDLVRRYFDQGRAGQSSWNKVASKHDVSRDCVRWWEGKVKDLLIKLDNDLEQCLGTVWRESGLIE